MHATSLFFHFFFYTNVGDCDPKEPTQLGTWHAYPMINPFTTKWYVGLLTNWVTPCCHATNHVGGVFKKGLCSPRSRCTLRAKSYSYPIVKALKISSTRKKKKKTQNLVGSNVMSTHEEHDWGASDYERVGLMKQAKNNYGRLGLIYPHVWREPPIVFPHFNYSNGGINCTIIFPVHCIFIHLIL